jgi:hypothetical protein
VLLLALLLVPEFVLDLPLLLMLELALLMVSELVLDLALLLVLVLVLLMFQSWRFYWCWNWPL